MVIQIVLVDDIQTVNMLAKIFSWGLKVNVTCLSSYLEQRRLTIIIHIEVKFLIWKSFLICLHSSSWYHIKIFDDINK